MNEYEALISNRKLSARQRLKRGSQKFEHHIKSFSTEKINSYLKEN